MVYNNSGREHARPQSSAIPFESQLLDASRFLNSAKTLIEQIDAGLYFDPRDLLTLSGIFQALQQQIDAAERSYLDYSIARKAEVRA